MRTEYIMERGDTSTIKVFAKGGLVVLELQAGEDVWLVENLSDSECKDLVSALNKARTGANDE